MKSIAIPQSNYTPWKGYFSLIDRVFEFVIPDEAQFTKNDCRNRGLVIAGSAEAGRRQRRALVYQVSCHDFA